MYIYTGPKDLQLHAQQYQYSAALFFVFTAKGTNAKIDNSCGFISVFVQEERSSVAGQPQLQFDQVQT